MRRASEFKISPIGDVHIGAAACAEDDLKKVIKRIQKEDNHYWIGMGDYGDFINMKDPRFSVSNLADWITREEMIDIAKAQRQRFTNLVKPIAHKCLGLASGNHETAIARHYERDVYGEIVSQIKEDGGFPSDYRLKLGYYGWIKLGFYSSKKKAKKGGLSTININIHHGFVGGKLAGAKALNMQRWLWTHAADLVIFGHSHNTSAQPEAVEYVDKVDNIKIHVRKGMYSGTFLKTVNDNDKGINSYSEIAGYFPNPHGVIPEAILYPRNSDENARVKIIS